MLFNLFKSKEQKELEAKKAIYMMAFESTLKQVESGKLLTTASLQSQNTQEKTALEAACLQAGAHFETVRKEAEFSALVLYLDHLLTKWQFGPDLQMCVKRALTVCQKQMKDLPYPLQEKYKTSKAYHLLQTAPLDKLRFKGAVDINLPKTETCYFAGTTFSWLEERKVTTSTSFTSTSRRAQFLGTNFRTGNIRTHRHTQDVWKQIASGSLYITSKRLIMKGRETKNIRLNKILDIEAFSNGLQIYRDTGKPVFIEKEYGSFEYGKLWLLLNRLIEES